MARPKKLIDPQKVEALAAIGCPTDEIAAELDCGINTIERRFGVLVKKGHKKCQKRVRSILFKQAGDGNTAAAIFLAKAICGWKEHPDTVINVSATATGGHITISDEQKKELSRMARIIRHQVLAESIGGSPNGANGGPASN